VFGSGDRCRCSPPCGPYIERESRDCRCSIEPVAPSTSQFTGSVGFLLSRSNSSKGDSSIPFLEHFSAEHRVWHSSSVPPSVSLRESRSRLEFGGSGGTIGGELNWSSRMDGESVFLLWYVRERDGDNADLLIGVYRTEADAEAAIDRLKSKAGFAVAPEGFRINRYELNRDHWEDGYVSGTSRE
jgi:hypothetical protein